MATNPVFEKLREIRWRRELTETEQAELETWLKANPEFRADWEAETALSSSLSQLGEPTVPSNFTARVLRAIEREAVPESRPQTTVSWWQTLTRRARWTMSTSLAAITVMLGLAVHEHQVQRQHELALAKRLKLISGVPNADILENFDTIRALNQAPPPDDKLLALLE